MRTNLLVAFTSALLICGQALSQTQADPEATTGITAKSLVTAQNHMIVAANPHASEAGDQMLAAGGSASDATIAALLVLNVVEPQSSGIGGGAFAVVYGPDGITSWDARETAPAGATPDMFMEDGDTLPFFDGVLSGRSIGAPGVVRLMEALHARHGKLGWAELFQPAIRLADAGFPVSARLAGLLERFGSRIDGTDAAALFFPDGKSLTEGDIHRQPALAETLRDIANNGADAFYSGRISEAILAKVAEAPRPGTLSAQDLASYQVIERPAVCAPFRSHAVCGMGPPSSGATTVGQILMLLDRFKPSDLVLEGPRLWHLFAEASRLAYADRGRYLADSDFVKVPIEGLLDKGYIAQRSQLIHTFEASKGKAEAGDPPWREGRLFAPDTQLDRPGTTHLSVIDSDGLAISLTASIETAFGSQRIAAGFLLNNQLTDFSFRPERDGKPIANAVAAGKRPRSSMAPTIVLRDDKPVILTGSPGGSRIPEYVAQNLVGMLMFGLDPAAAAALPHVSHRNRDAVALEAGMPDAVVDGLGKFGHTVEIKDMNSGVHSIVIGGDGSLSGGADPRREGVAIGR